MTYGFDTKLDAEEQAFALVELRLRQRGVTSISLEYSEGVELAGPSGSARKVSIKAALDALARKL